jgi:hypothetical protein
LCIKTKIPALAGIQILRACTLPLKLAHKLCEKKIPTLSEYGKAVLQEYESESAKKESLKKLFSAHITTFEFICRCLLIVERRYKSEQLLLLKLCKYGRLCSNDFFREIFDSIEMVIFYSFYCLRVLLYMGSFKKIIEKRNAKIAPKIASKIASP